MKILNIGSLNIDLVYHVEHFVRAGETIAATSFARFAGGKGLNQSIALARAGATIAHGGKIGTDGLFLMELLKEAHADVSHILEDGSATGTAFIQVQPDGQNCIIIHSGANGELTPQDMAAAFQDFSAGDALLLQNEVNNLPLAMGLAKEHGMRICLNPSPINQALLDAPLDLVDCFILNEVEGYELSGQKEPEAILTALRARFPKASFVLTLGADGAVCHAEGKTYRQASFPVTSVDTTAAGDTFTGYYLAALARGQDIPAALRLASKAASIAVTRPGATPSIPLLAEVEAALA